MNASDLWNKTLDLLSRREHSVSELRNKLIRFNPDSNDLKDVIEKISIKTRQYAKRQSTWARGQMSNWNKISSKELKKILKKI